MRPRLSLRRALTAGAVGAAVVMAPLLVSTPAAAEVRPATPTATCTVSAADLTWGFKESFRSYISGSIAKGAWETSGGASYATPLFSWAGGTGVYDPSSATGSVAFPGSIRFTGHGGLLDTTVSSPVLEFTGTGTARMLVDLSGVSMEDALAGGTESTTVEGVPLVDIDLSAAIITEDASAVTLTVTDAATSITAEGFEAFGNYETGTAFDPITISVVVECPVEESLEPTPEPTPASSADEPLTDAAAEAPADVAAWGAWTVGAVVIVALGGLGFWLVRARRGGPTAGDQR